METPRALDAINESIKGLEYHKQTIFKSDCPEARKWMIHRN
jgi:oligoribonuclease (3'-5' exoribonuclease)